jgi:hypothetical protein
MGERCGNQILTTWEGEGAATSESAAISELAKIGSALLLAVRGDCAR